MLIQIHSLFSFVCGKMRHFMVSLQITSVKHLNIVFYAFFLSCNFSFQFLLVEWEELSSTKLTAKSCKFKAGKNWIKSLRNTLNSNDPQKTSNQNLDHKLYVLFSLIFCFRFVMHESNLAWSLAINKSWIKQSKESHDV